MAQNFPTAWVPNPGAIGGDDSLLTNISGIMLPAPSNGMLVWCSQAGVQDYYRLDLNNTGTIDGFNFLKTSLQNAPNSRWVKTNMQGPASGSRPLPKIVSGSFLILSTDGDFYVDTTTLPATGLLSAAPVQWEFHQLKDYLENSSVNAIEIDGNGKNIEQPGGAPAAPTLILGVGGYGGDGVSAVIQYNGTTWSFFG